MHWTPEISQSNSPVRANGIDAIAVAPRLDVAALLAVWSVPALLTCAQRFFFVLAAGSGALPGSEWWRVFLSQAPPWYAWAALTPLILRIATAFPLGPGRRRWTIAAHVAMCALCLLAHAMTYVAAGALTGTIPTRFTPRTYIVPTILSYLPVVAVIYAAVVGFGAWRAADARARRREVEAMALTAQLSRAQLMALRMQIQPHFLFNALNTVAVLVGERDHDAAALLIAKLSGVLRSVLRGEPDATVPLRDEIALLGEYLDIEQVRFADRLRVTWELDADALDVPVPAFVLQPLVENAIRHGVGRSPEGGTLEIGAQLDPRALVLWVRDDGAGDCDASFGATDGAAIGSTGGLGIGLANTRARIAQLYGARATLTLDVRGAQGTIARISLPRADT